ncbi:transcriptional regulation of mitochondrial recombination domain-containing protein [Sarocladium implicatum]|nr:transcriptional regulation of mitochondrial recombination domain-containing protein [Sarocladium implicatum]
MNSAQRLRLTQLPSLLPKQWVRKNHNRKPKKATTGFVGPEGHGEKIWIWAHRRSEQTIYTFREQLDGFHDMKQLSFHGKKTRPAKLRKDYWSPMAIINFPKGQGSVGRSVFQKLRELKHLHEVNWASDFRYKTPDEYTEGDKQAVANAEAEGREFTPLRTKKDRGMALNRQKANTIADMAAVLAGQGKGNRMAEVSGVEAEAEAKLLDVTISWRNTLDQNYAMEWTDNVSHELISDAAETLEEGTEMLEGDVTRAEPTPSA